MNPAEATTDEPRTLGTPLLLADPEPETPRSFLHAAGVAATKAQASAESYYAQLAPIRPAIKIIFALLLAFPAFIYAMLSLQDDGNTEINLSSSNSASLWNASTSLVVNFAAYFMLGLDTFDLLIERNHPALVYQFFHQIVFQTKTINENIIDTLVIAEESVKFASMYYSAPFLAALSDQVKYFNSPFFRIYARFYSLSYLPGINFLSEAIKHFIRKHVVLTERHTFFSILDREVVTLEETFEAVFSHMMADIQKGALLNTLPRSFNINKLLEATHPLTEGEREEALISAGLQEADLTDAAKDAALREIALKQAFLQCATLLNSKSKKSNNQSIAFIIGFITAAIGSTGYDRATYLDENFTPVEKASAITLDILLLLIMAYKFSLDFSYNNIPAADFLETHYGKMYLALAIIAYTIAGFSYHPAWYDNKEISTHIAFFLVCWLGTEIFNGSFTHDLLKQGYNYLQTRQNKTTPLMQLDALRTELQAYLRALTDNQKRELLRSIVESSSNTAVFQREIATNFGWCTDISDLYHLEAPTHRDYNLQREHLESKYSFGAAAMALMLTALIAQDETGFNEASATTYILLAIITALALSGIAYEAKPSGCHTAQPYQKALLIFSTSVIHALGLCALNQLAELMCTAVLTMDAAPKTILPTVATLSSWSVVKISAERMREKASDTQTLSAEPITSPLQQSRC